MKASTSIAVSLLFLVLTSQVGSASVRVDCSDVSDCMYEGYGKIPCACSGSEGNACVNGYWTYYYQGETGRSSCVAGVWQPLCEQIGITPKVCYTWVRYSTRFSFRSCVTTLPSAPLARTSVDGKNGAGDKACRQCPANSFPENGLLSSPSNVGSEKCSCGPGTYTFDGSNGARDKACRQCLANSQAEQEYGSRRCYCNADYLSTVGFTDFSPENSNYTSFTACDEGKWKPSVSSGYGDTCYKCRDNSGSSVRGSTSETSCSCNATISRCL